MLISTCGVRKCIGGVALSVDLAPVESPESLKFAALLLLPPVTLTDTLLVKLLRDVVIDPSMGKP